MAKVRPHDLITVITRALQSTYPVHALGICGHKYGWSENCNVCVRLRISTRQLVCMNINTWPKVYSIGTVNGCGYDD